MHRPRLEFEYLLEPRSNRGFFTLDKRAGDLTLKFGAFKMGGIGTATFGAIILYQIRAWDSAEQ